MSLIDSNEVDHQLYTFEARASYPPKIEQVPASGATLHYVFPAHSFTQIVVGVER